MLLDVGCRNGRGAAPTRTLGCGRSRLLLSAVAASSSAEAASQRTGPGACMARRVRSGAAEARTQRSMLARRPTEKLRSGSRRPLSPPMRAPLLLLALAATLCVLAPVPAMGSDGAAADGVDEPQAPHYEDGEFANMCAPPPPPVAVMRAQRNALTGGRHRDGVGPRQAQGHGGGAEGAQGRVR